MKEPNLELIKLTPDSKDLYCFEQINQEAFPDSERMPLDNMFAFASDSSTDILGIYENSNPSGFAMVVTNEQSAYIFYFAMAQQVRGKGYGSIAMKQLIERYPDLQITLDFEELDEKAANAEQRIRRKRFYLNNGFHETGRMTMLRHQNFEVVCTKGELNQEALKDLIEVIHARCPEFPNVLL